MIMSAQLFQYLQYKRIIIPSNPKGYVIYFYITGQEGLHSIHAIVTSRELIDHYSPYID